MVRISKSTPKEYIWKYFRNALCHSEISPNLFSDIFWEMIGFLFQHPRSSSHISFWFPPRIYHFSLLTVSISFILIGSSPERWLISRVTDKTFTRTSSNPVVFKWLDAHFVLTDNVIFCRIVI
jgi:hypothetical protein